MILGIGTDIVSIARIAELYRDTGERFLARVCSTAEIAQFRTKSDAAEIRYLAKRFAAKEAVAKALGTGIGARAAFTEISITNDATGKPVAILTGAAAETLSALAGGKPATVHLSLSDEGDTALAFVVICSE